MTVAYLVLAHNTPNHIYRLPPALTGPGVSIFVHVDRKVDIEPYQGLFGFGGHMHARGVFVFWGGDSQGDGILPLIRETFSQSPALDHLVLLSGSDYPLASGSHIVEFLRRSRGVEFINAARMPNDRLGKSLYRLTEYLPRSDRA